MTKAHPRHLRRYIVVPLLLLGLGYVAYFCYTRMTHRPDSRTAYWEARLREINPQTPEMMPFEEVIPLLGNAAGWVIDCPGAFPEKSDLGRVSDGIWDARSNPEIACAIELFNSQTFIVEFAAFRESLRRGWTPPPDLSEDQRAFNHSRGCRTAASMLIAYSRFAREELSDPAAQWSAWNDALILSDQLRNTRTWRDLMVAYGIRWRVAIEVARTIGEIPANEHVPFLHELLIPEAELQLTSSQRIAGRVLEERAELDHVFVGKGGWLDVSEAHHRYIDFNQYHSRLWNLVSPIFLSRAEAEARFGNELIRLDHCTNMCELNAAYANEASTDDEASMLMVRVMHFRWFDGFAQLLNQFFRGATTSEAAACMMALHNYRADKTEYPTALSQLVPAYMPRLPIDFADGDVLRYRRIDDGYVLYSVGGDCVDNHGTPYDPSSKFESEWTSVNTDVLFINRKRRVYAR